MFYVLDIRHYSTNGNTEVPNAAADAAAARTEAEEPRTLNN